jgi:hypothetical protein
MTLPASYFDTMYAGSDDPWSFETRWYDRRKYALTLAALPRPRYARAFEPGCSIGVLTEGLAARCDSLLAVDTSAAAVRRTRQRLRAHPQVEVEQWALPAWPPGSFDLVLLSEVGYYLGPADLRTMLAAAAGSLRRGGELVSVHWRHPVADHPLRGDAVHAAIAELPSLRRLSRVEEDDFLLEVFVRTPPAARSVAAREGLC